MRIKVNDLVQVIAGRHRYKYENDAPLRDENGNYEKNIGRVVRLDKKRSRVFVEGVNLVKRHQKQTPYQESAILEKEASIHVSNVALYSEKEGRSVRTSYRYLGKNNELFESKYLAKSSYVDENAPSVIKKVRVSRSGEVFE